VGRKVPLQRQRRRGAASKSRQATRPASSGATTTNRQRAPSSPSPPPPGAPSSPRSRLTSERNSTLALPRSAERAFTWTAPPKRGRSASALVPDASHQAAGTSHFCTQSGDLLGCRRTRGPVAHHHRKQDRTASPTAAWSTALVGYRQLDRDHVARPMPGTQRPAAFSASRTRVAERQSRARTVHGHEHQRASRRERAATATDW